jgi:RNA polymerase sigma-70 factor (ECF subfamily)
MTDPKPTDDTLVLRARQGDERAFQELVERHSPAIRRKIRKRLPAALTRKVSESDVLQSAYLIAHRKLGSFENRGSGAFEAWVDRIAALRIRELVRHYRGTAKRGVDREPTRDDRPSVGELEGGEGSPSAHAIAGELEERVAEAIQQLPEDYRTVLRLVREEGLPAAEVARRMNRSANAVAKLYARAVCHLKEQVLDEETG